MADVNEEDGASKPNSTLEEDGTPMVLTPATVTTTSKDEENIMVEPEINQEPNKQDSLTEGETNEAQPDAVIEKDEEKTEKQIKGENLGGVLDGKGIKPRKRIKKKKVAKNERNVIVATSNGLTVEEEHVKEKAKEEEETNGKDVKEESEKTEEKNKLPESSNGRGRKPKRKRMKKVAQKGSTDMVVVDVDKPESSSKKKVESMGMVFMCSSKTKADCFQYKILGLPAGKKDQVAKIYKGMRLFLFDVDLRLMYGIYKAAEAGGYNLEPKAFKSAFPSQVRFTVMEDCLPLAEEKFKNVIKENYYSRNKFNGQLNSQQVKKLCKLLAASKSGPSPKKAIKSHQIRGDAYTSRPRENRKRWAREVERRPHPSSGRDQRRYHEYGQPPVRHQREAFRSPVHPVARYLPQLPPQEVAAPVRSYVYEGAYSYDRDPEPRRDMERHQLYSREAPIYRDNVYPSVEQMVEYHHQQLPPPAAALPPQYHLVGREYQPPPLSEEYHLSRGLQVHGYRDVGNTSDYFSSSASVPEYRSHLTRYGY